MDRIDLTALQGLRVLPNLNERFRSKITLDGECWIWCGSRNTGGYGVFALPVISTRGPALRTEMAHALMFEMVHGCKATGLVLHSCDRPACVRPEHLREGTAADNAQDKIARGRWGFPFSRRHAKPEPIRAVRGRAVAYNQRVTDAQAVEMRERYAADPTVTAGGLARRYHISRLHAGKILRGVVHKKAGGPVVQEIRPVVGERVQNAVLSAEAVIAARARFKRGGVTGRELAQEYGVSPGVMSQALRGLNWGHLGGPLKRSGGAHRITEAELADLRERHQAGETGAALAKAFSISRATVSLLVRGKSRPHH